MYFAIVSQSIYFPYTKQNFFHLQNNEITTNILKFQTKSRTFKVTINHESRGVSRFFIIDSFITSGTGNCLKRWCGHDKKPYTLTTSSVNKMFIFANYALIFLGFRTSKGKDGTLIGSLCCLSVKTIYLEIS